MKKFILVLNVILLLLVPTIIITNSDSSTIKYKTNTTTDIKMLKTTILIDRSNKKKEEEENKKRELEELLRLEKIEEEKKKEAEKNTKAIKEIEYTSSLSKGGNVSNVEQKEVVANSDKNVFVGAKFYSRKVSAYGTDCCGSKNISEEEKYNGLATFGLGQTASGYQLQYKNINFNAGDYGNVRIVAADKNFPIGTIVKITERMNDGSYETFNAIVLDRGDRNIGLNSKYIFDLLLENEQIAYSYGVHYDIDVEVLKVGNTTDQQNIKRYGHL